MTKNIKDAIDALVYDYEHPGRKALSLRFPLIKKPILRIHILLRHANNSVGRSRAKKTGASFSHTATKHQSVLRRKLGDSNPLLQEMKITNIKHAIYNINQTTINPGESFSFWETVGKPTYKRGFVDGMLLSRGKVIKGVGGGLCQLSNLLYWMFLHTSLTVTERHHHSMDVFPDSGRVLPFGSGATIMYNFIDLQVYNNTPDIFHIELGVNDTHLLGRITSNHIQKKKYHIIEKNHCFIQKQNLYFRYNELYREGNDSEGLHSEHITTNFAPVLYTPDKTQLQKDGYTFYTL